MSATVFRPDEIGQTPHAIVRGLTIAGSDSGGGAGIQADLKTMHQMGVYGMSVLTAVTAQNTMGVQGVTELSPAFVAKQFASVMSDIGVNGVKTGMLASVGIIETVAQCLAEAELKNVVVDPVMIAKGGHPLITTSAIDVMKRELLPQADVVTPNLPEARALCGHSIESFADCHRAMEEMARMGVETVILKGGHFPKETYRAFAASFQSAKLSDALAIDMVFHAGQYTYFLTPFVDSRKTHGTGCTFSSAVMSLLAQGFPLLDAVATAKIFIYHAIEGAQSWSIGQGHGPTNHFVQVQKHTGISPGQAYYFDQNQFHSLT